MLVKRAIHDRVECVPADTFPAPAGTSIIRPARLRYSVAPPVCARATRLPEPISHRDHGAKRATTKIFRSSGCRFALAKISRRGTGPYITHWPLLSAAANSAETRGTSSPIPSLNSDRAGGELVLGDDSGTARFFAILGRRP